MSSHFSRYPSCGCPPDCGHCGLTDEMIASLNKGDANFYSQSDKGNYIVDLGKEDNGFTSKQELCKPIGVPYIKPKRGTNFTKPKKKRK